MRSAFNSGCFAAVLNKGAAEAGAIFILWRKDFSYLELIGPAPQFAYDGSPKRLFERLLNGADDVAISAKLEKERSYDPDIWIVELETITLPDMIEIAKLSDS